MLRLPTTSLLPPEAVSALDQRFGARFRKLGEIQRLAVVVAYLEEKVTNRRLRMITDTHASDLTTLLKSLVGEGFLVPDGVGRGTSYRLSGGQDLLLLSDSLFSLGTSAGSGESNSEHLSSNSEQSSLHSESDPELNERLIRIAAPIKRTRNAPATSVRQAILELCRFGYLPLTALAELLGRKPDTLRVHYISTLLAEGVLEYQYPDRINHPTQGYRTKATNIENEAAMRT